MTKDELFENFLSSVSKDDRFKGHTASIDGDWFKVESPDGVFGIFSIPDDMLPYFLKEGDAEEVIRLHLDALNLSINEERARLAGLNEEAV